MKSDLDALMQARNLDALLVVGAAEHNPPMYYFTGGGHVSSAILVKKRGGAPILFYNDMERDEAAKTGLSTRSLSEYPLQEYAKEAGENLVLLSALQFKHILSDAGLTQGRLGIYGRVELSNVLGILMKLKELLPDLEVVGEEITDSVLVRAMETKEESEVDRIRRMGRITTEVVRLTAD